MTKQEQIEEMAKIVDEMYNVYTTTADDIADGLYNAGYRKIPENAVVLTNEDLTKEPYNEFCKGCPNVRTRSSGITDCCADYNCRQFTRYANLIENYEQARKETAKEIFQKVVNICRKEEDFQDGTVNTQLEPLYFGIMNGCAFIRDEVKKLAEQYGVEVEE